MERAVARVIARCKKPDRDKDALYALAGQPPPHDNVVLVTAWHVYWERWPMDVHKPILPTEAQLKSAARAMHSFVRKHPQYGLISSRGGRGRLCLYEVGDDLSAMWAKLFSQRQGGVTLNIAKDALKHLKALRNEPFTVYKHREIHHREPGGGLSDSRKDVFLDISLP
jgi:hypothetical protein